MNPLVAAESEPQLDEAAVDESRTAASRGLLLVAALLIAVPAAVGLYILRSGSVPSPPGTNSGTEQPFTLPAPGDEGPTSADLLRPGTSAASSRIRYATDGEPSGLANGGRIPLNDGLSLRVWVNPYPPTDFSTDIELVLETGLGEPVTDASITTVWDMVMVHGPFQTSFSHAGNGRYQAEPFDFFMYGPWQLNTTIEATGRQMEVQLAIYVWPE